MKAETVRSPATFELRHAHAPIDLRACYPVIKLLRSGLRDEPDWMMRVSHMREDDIVFRRRRGAQKLSALRDR